MRIGFDAKRYFLNKSGLGNYSRDLVRILETYYPENTYLKYTPKTNLSKIEDKTIRLPQGKLKNGLSSLWRNKWIVDDLARDHIDIYHGLSGEIPHGLHKKGIKSVVTMHDLIFLKFPELYKPLDRYIYNRKFKRATLEADKIVAISEQTKRDLMEFYYIREQQIEVVYQGCHPAFKIQKTTSEKEILRKKYNLPTRFVLNVGSIEPRKNAFHIVKAVESLDIPLVIIGKETKYSKEIQSYIHAKGLQKKIFILQGFTMEELSTIYAMAEAFVYPSKYEGFGIPIIEALYSGTPVITTISGVFPEAGGPLSYYVNPEDIEELRYAIQSVVENTTMREEMIGKGLEYVQQFNDDNIAAQWNKIYIDLL